MTDFPSITPAARFDSGGDLIITAFVIPAARVEEFLRWLQEEVARRKEASK